MGSFYRNKLLIFVYFAMIVANISARKFEIPSYVHLCSRNSKSLEKCVMKTVEEDIRPRLANGIKEMGIPPLEPLIVPEVSLDTGSTFAAKFKNLHVYYATEFVLKNAYMNLDEDSFKLALHFPRLRITSNYNINGRLLILDLNGSGKSDGNITNIDALAEYHGKRVKKNNKEYIDFTQSNIKLQIGDGRFYFENLINGNEELSEATNKVINENIKEIIEELKPVIEETVGTVVFTVIKRVFSHFAVDDLFPTKS